MIQIRSEQPSDHATIYDITKRAFAPMPFADGDEQDLINKLRDAGALAISLVAEQDHAVIGHIAFSPAFAEDGSAGWYALGPVAVEPARQKQGIGGQLIRAGIEELRKRDAAGCVLVGNPAIYGRFGFALAPELTPVGHPAEYFQILPLRIAAPNAVVNFHPLFEG